MSLGRRSTWEEPESHPTTENWRRNGGRRATMGAEMVVDKMGKPFHVYSISHIFSINLNH